MKPAKIKILLLDIGDVLLHIDWRQFFLYLNLVPEDYIFKMEMLFLSEYHHQAECGKISDRDFFLFLHRELAVDCTVEQIQGAWNSVIAGEVAGVYNLLKKLGQNIDLFALSNTNKTHIETEIPKYKVFSLIKKIFASYELGFRKPEPEIYLKTLSQLPYRPHEILFLDDRIENVDAAKKLGINAEVCKTSAKQMEQITKDYL